MAGRTATPGASVTSRALAILAAFDADHRSLTLTEIAARAGLSRPTAHRLIAELTAWGALRRDAQGRYVVGRRLWNLGMLAPVQADLREAASPFLHDLYGATLETVQLAVRDGLETLYVDRLAGHRSVPIVSTIGSRLPMHATGVGKVLLAFAPPEVQQAVLGAPLRRFTPYTVTSAARLADQLDRARAEGYATTAEEMSAGACSVAVPVLVGDTAVAAVGFVVPDLRRTRPRLVAALQVAAQGIARSL
ncbi:IclR family transcriptional regulator [Nocardioides sp. BP30]|uniref:IclR family transcriptional regulator n=1 Tax=Nocardioides sp. BP30 TaxID=3036374 RepID=UPI002469C03D|nr:IclR family transcriptional regulator [Nocardioides sp. BP30]WGL52214.1 IclR family transcriptional regulator [Nocardioides sp. BP30]